VGLYHILRGQGGVSNKNLPSLLGECVMIVRANGHSPLQRIGISHLPVGLYFVNFANYLKKFMVVM